jgi:putative ABC transport system permease protein
VTSVEEAVRARRRGSWVSHAMRDARYGLRVLRRAPAFATAVIATLALAIGATAAMTATLRAIVVAPLPYPDGDRLVHLTGLGYVGEYLQLVERATTLEVAAYSETGPATLTGQGDPARLEVVATTSDLFQVLGVAPAVGSGWVAHDSFPGAEPVVILSDRVWREQFAGRATIVGSIIDIDGTPRRVRGVMPHDFAFPRATVDLWTPAIINPSDRVAIWSLAGTLVARLRPHATLDDAIAEVRAIAPGFASLFPWRMPPAYGENASVVPLKAQLVGDVDVMLAAALGAVLFVLFIACFNVGVLLLGRSMARRVEMATRAALGASRGRLVRQVLAECGVLAGLGGLLGLGVALLAVSSASRLLPPDVPRLTEVAPDGWLLLTAAGLTVVAALLTSAGPAWRAARPVAAPSSSVRHASEDRKTRATTRVLVAAEIALAVSLVVGAGLLVRSLDRLLDVDPGFRPDDVVSASIAPPLHRFNDASVRRVFYDDVIARLEASPQVAGVAMTDRLPFASPPWGTVFSIEGRPDPASESGEWPWADYRAAASASYFDTIGMRITTGRSFGSSDTAASERVAIISDALARQYWPDEAAVGRRVRFPGMRAGEWITIVGTVADAKWERLSEAPKTALFLPIAQSVPETVAVIARVDGDLVGVAGALRAVVHGVDPDVAVDRIVTLGALVRSSARTSRFLAVLFSLFAAVGVLLGVLGVYGVTADAVVRRRHEIAIRMAVGAEAGSIVRLVARQSVLVSAIGLAVGLVVARAGARLLAGLLFGVAPTDPLTFIVGSVGLIVAGIVACVVPALRATRIDPLSTLRES